MERIFALHLQGHKEARVHLLWDQLKDGKHVKTENDQAYELAPENFFYRVHDHLGWALALAGAVGLGVLRLLRFERRDRSVSQITKNLEKLGGVKLPSGKSMFDRVGDYYVLRALGEGNFGGVFLACHRQKINPSGLVTIKRLLKEGDKTERDRALFQREGKRAQSIQHPSVVQILEYDAESPEPYLVMEYIRGTNLENYLKERASPTMTAQDALAIFQHIAEGLQASTMQASVTATSSQRTSW